MLEGLLLILGGVTLILLALLYGVFAWGYILWKFWYWFLLPVFPTMPNVTVIECVGLMLIITLFKTHSVQAIKKEYQDEKLSNAVSFLAPIIVFLVGWIVHTFIVR